MIGNDGQNTRYEETANSWMLIPIRVEGENASLRKRRILDFLESHEIETRPVLTGNFLAQPSMNRIDGNHPPASDFPVATEITDTCFLVGAHHDLSDEQILHLCKKLHEAKSI